MATLALTARTSLLPFDQAHGATIELPFDGYAMRWSKQENVVDQG